ncbi:hypothetical protein GCM10023191_035070 [Actinoallomurus oryzae]|uniref:D-inositol 3-phosphate glycosyltransferase n=1 Tax=Actinoallomurus oryzae TaxID=502180 RepID=A0ABP8PY21_9ACTN
MNRSRRRPPRFLAIVDEWSPAKGGVSAFNRALTTALVRCGHPTACLVERATPSEFADASARGVTLLTAEELPGGPSLLVPSAGALEFGADVVLGHDRFSGPAAWAYAHRYLGVRLAHIIHTAPVEIERYKSTGEATRRTEEKEAVNLRVAADAYVTAAVGPRLARYAMDLLEDGRGRPRVVQLDPGIEVGTADVRCPPVKPRVLVLGRTGDVVLKGLDLAAHAVNGVGAPGGPPLELLVRGAPAAECDALHGELVALSGLARERIDVRPYTTDPAELRRDMARSALCLLPSRVEGFGLVAFEAIAAGTPVLVSAKSGAAELLRATLGRSAEPMVVDITDDLGTDVARWRMAVGAVMADPAAAFAYAHEMRHRLAGRLSWDATAASLVRAVTGDTASATFTKPIPDLSGDAVLQ